jgi:hypothetical protein
VKEALLNSVFGEVSRESLDADTAVCFILDADLRLIYCNPAWDRFSSQNGAPELRAENVLGMSAVHSTSGQLAGYYQSLYYKVLQEQKPHQHDFHCSSADVERLMTMHIYPFTSGALLVASSLRLERPHPIPTGLPLPALYRDEHGIIVMCSNCRRTRRVGGETETWDWISEFVAHHLPGVSHGLCNLCLEYYY